MKRLTIFCVALLTAATTFATVTYELNGGITNDYGWQGKGDMFAAFMTDAGATADFETLEYYMQQVDPLGAHGICSKLTDASPAIKMTDKWGWLEEYLMTAHAAQSADGASALTAGGSGAAWRYAVGAFFISGQRTGWPKSADFSFLGQVTAFMPAWRHAFANPESVNTEFTLNSPYKEGYTFIGWYATADFSGEKVVKIDASTTGTLYAKWIEYIPTIAEVKALADNTNTFVAGVVNYVGGKSTYIQDATDGIVIRSSKALDVKVGDKVTFYGKKTTYNNFAAVSSDSIMMSEVSTLPTATSFESLSSLVADVKDSVYKYNAMLVRVPGLKITSYDKYSNPYVTDNTDTVNCYYMALDSTEYPVGTKVTVTAVATSYKGTFQFTGDAAGIEKVVVGKKDAYVYPARGENGEYTLVNNWVISNVEDNYEANKPGPTDFVRGMAAKDGKMYFINRSTASITVVDAATGDMLEPIKITGDHVFEVLSDTAAGTWKSGVTLAYNDIKFDGAGNCLIGCCTGTASYFMIYKVDLTTGAATQLICERLYDNPDFLDNGFRFDAFGVYGDVNNNAIIMAQDFNSFNAYKWTITNGIAGKAEEIACVINPSTDKSLLISDGVLSVTNYGTCPQIFPVDENYFYIDGWSTLPMLFDMDGILKEDFISCPTGVNVVNNEGDTCKMNQGHNGLVEFQVGGDYFLLMAATNTVGSPASTFALYKFADEKKEFSGLTPMWYFPANGMGSATNGCRVAVPAVEVKDNVATLYLYTNNNGYASYTLTAPLGSKLSLLSANEEMGYVSGDGTYKKGNVTISATANTGYHFTQWNDGNTENPRVISLSQDTTFTAYFEVNQYTISTASNYPERGTTSKDTIADYLTNVTIYASANYGYHFSQWNDGNTENPRVVKVIQSETYTAYFEKNIYNLSASADNGYVTYTIQGEYLDAMTLMVSANSGYHFSQWSDGNTDNPRTIILTRDTTLFAQCILTNSGQCGDNLYWDYANNVLTISGYGAMYDYTGTIMPWYLLLDSISSVQFADDMTSVGAYAFYGCKNLTSVNITQKVTSIGSSAFATCSLLGEVYLGKYLTNIGDGAFYNCRKLFKIYCYAVNPPTAETSSFANYNAHLYIPCESKEDYDVDMVFGSFKYIECMPDVTPSDIDEVGYDEQAPTRKVFMNGHLFILREGKVYTATGEEVR